ncbi:MAG: RNA-directed DNA polymerase [Isosphaeraceae bacterium]
MSESAWPRKLHVRSLNYLYRSHIPTYVAARLLAESLHPSHIEEWSNSYVLRKCQTNRRQVYWKHSLFKGFDSEGRHEYRKCVIGSPTTQLAEVWLLDRLSREPSFELPSYVYSYNLSSSQRPHIYRHFYNGYRNRENAVAEAASRLKDARVVVFDLRRFYPSVNVEHLRRRFNERVASTTLSKDERDVSIQCVAELTSIKNETGLPIGPPLSHALANVFLSDFDAALSTAYPGRYFRYVDDVAIVASPSEVETVKTFFEETAKAEGLQVHRGKLDVIPAGAWQYQLNRRNSNGANEFNLLLGDVRRYLAHNPHDFESLKATFRSEGFSLPFSRLRSVAVGSSRFRRFLNRMYTWAHRENIPRPASLIQRAHDIRRYATLTLERSLSELDDSSNGMQRRWHIQHLRNLINRSLYLMPDDHRSALLKRVPDYLELHPTKVVLEALVTNDASAVMKYPGPTVSAFCELWLETKNHRPTVDWSSAPAKEERDSASVIALYGLCSPPEDWTNQLVEASSRTMVRLTSREQPKQRSFDDFSYIDEIESLFLRPAIKFDQILSSRFDEGEDVVLPALDLGGQHYLS